MPRCRLCNNKADKTIGENLMCLPCVSYMRHNSENPDDGVNYNPIDYTTYIIKSRRSKGINLKTFRDKYTDTHIPYDNINQS